MNQLVYIHEVSRLFVEISHDLMDKHFNDDRKSNHLSLVHDFVLYASRQNSIL